MHHEPEYFVCVSCNKKFRIWPEEVEYRKQSRIPLPMRCIYCEESEQIRKEREEEERRAKRKAMREKREAEYRAREDDRYHFTPALMQVPYTSHKFAKAGKGYFSSFWRY